MENDDLFGMLAEMERRRAEMRLRMRELDKMQFWLFFMLGTSMLLLSGSILWLTGCALARAAL